MRILITGSTGLVGSALVPDLESAGHSVTRLSHSQPWPALEGFDAVVHLAGENIAAGRWTRARKALIRDSRVMLTQQLAEAVAKLAHPPRVFVSASAVGFYGSRGDELLSEDSGPGNDFLATVCRDWESAAKPASDSGLRVANLRFGVILSASGGALAKMLLPFRLCVGGIIGGGRQCMSWVAMDDAIGAIYHTLTNDSLHGPVNVVAPQPVTNREFTKTLGRVLRRPTILPMPAFAARLAFGEMADALLLASQRVEPVKLVSSGYAFKLPELEGALRHVLGARFNRRS